MHLADQPMGATHNRAIPFIIIVNDDEVQRELLSRVVSGLPAEVRAFPGVPSALAALPGLPVPQLIITDLYMPGIDGWRFTRLLRSPEFAEYNTVPILVTSATYAGDDPIRVSRDTTATGFLPLPCESQRIIQTVVTVLNRGRLENDTTILLVDDDPTTLIMLEHAFTHAGYTARSVRTGREARAHLEARDFDGVVLDYHLPDLRGDVLLEQFAPQHPDAVFLMVTADPEQQLALQWMEWGASAYIRKPAEPRFVVETYRRARRERSLLRIEERLEERTGEVKRLLAEQKLLTREIHHRVKNNLAALSALFELRSEAVMDLDARNVLMQARHDVENVASVYESLFESEEGRLVDPVGHIGNLVSRVTSRYASATISVNVDPECGAIEATTAMRVGIILNELLTNAMKYAFPSGRSGTISVDLHREDTRCTLRVADDGVGIPAGGSAEPARSGSTGFGLQMVALMSEQIGAVMETRTENGTEIVIRGIPGACDG